MKKKMRFMYRISSFLMMLLMAVSIFASIPLTTGAAQVTKIEKNYDIAVVFDNSGSMYNNQGWCRAKYAMEIFASMLNYEKDKLHIFPMWEVTTDGSQPDSGGSHAAIDVKSKNDIDKISNLYTVHPSNTPFEPITEAYAYLLNSQAEEKWLIILTDGAFNQEKRNQDATIDLQKRVPSLASEDIKVQYLGFGGATELESDEANNFFAKKSSDTSLKDDLIKICNSIFQRSVLPNNRLNGTSLNLDLSMKNVIVFAQGANAKISSLKNSDGKEIAITLDSGQRKYSEIKAKGYADAPIDTSLAGQVVTFAACPKGEYTLSYTGTDAIQIFYEPDVDIDVSIINSDGEKVDNPDEFYAGEYTVTSRIIDSSTGEDVTSHELMGKDVKLITKVKTSKDSDYKDYANGSKIVFEPDESTDIIFEGKYLGKYSITSEGNPDLKWLNECHIKPRKVDLQIDATVLQTQSWFKINDHDNWKPIRVTLTIDGQPLTDEQLNDTELSITSSGNLECRCEPIKGESAFNVYIAQDENGKYVEPETGKYKVNASAVFTDEYGEEIGEEDDVSFEIQRYSKFWRWLKWILLILGIIGLLAFILTRKAFPNKIVFVEETNRGKVRTKKMKIKDKGKLVIPINSALTLKTAKETRLYQKFSKSASFRVVSIDNPRSTVSSFSIRQREYSSGMDFKDSMGKSFNGVITNNTSISITFNDGHGTIKGKIKIN